MSSRDDSYTQPLFDLPEPRRSTVGRAQWVLTALAPAQRRHHIQHYLDPWVTWLVHTYRLRTAIPPCWYRHPDITERLKNLMAAWIATFTDDPSDHLTDRPFAYVEFDDALERELHRITAPPACLDGDHQDPPSTWTTDNHQADWLATSTWATTAPAHPAPDFTGHPAARTETTMTDQPSQHSQANQPGQSSAGGLVMSRTDGDTLVKDGQAQAMRDYAIHYDGAWWLGDQNTYVRVTDDALNHKLDFKAIKLARADQAVARTQQRHDEPAEKTPGTKGRPGDRPGDGLDDGVDGRDDADEAGADGVAPDGGGEASS